MRQDFYEEYARIELGHWWFVARREIVLTVLRMYLPKGFEGEGAVRSVLDVGIGSGVMLQYLEPLGRIFGCDRAWAALLYSFPKAAGRVVQADAEHLPFRQESLDLVTLLDLLEHTVDDEGVLRDVGRLLRPNGFLCATVPAYQWLWGNQDLVSGHLRRYQPGELERKIQAAGLGIVYRSYFNTFLFPFVALIRLARRCSGLVCGGSAALDPEGAASDFSMTKPGRLNDTLAWIFSQEARWLRRWQFPVGVSLLCLAQKRDKSSGECGMRSMESRDPIHHSALDTPHSKVLF